MDESPLSQDSFGPYWSRSLILKLIELYKQNNLLWEIKHSCYHDKFKKIEAWQNIASELGFPVSAIRRKILSLLGCYRRYKSRYKRKIAEGCSRSLAEPKWFAFHLLSFLDSNREQKPTYADVIEDIPSTSIAANKKLIFKAVKKPKREIILKKRNLKKHKLKTKPPPPTSVDGEIEIHNINITNEEVVTKIMEDIDICDQYYMYGLYIANELRKYDKLTLAKVKHAINKIIFDADLKQIADNAEGSLSGDPDDPLEEFEVDYDKGSDLDAEVDAAINISVKNETNESE